MSTNKYRIPELRSSLCGCSLETGAKIIGWLSLVFGALTFVLAILIAIGITAVSESHEFKDENDTKHKDVMKAFLFGFGVITWFMAFFGILQILINLLLLKGVYEKKSSYVWPWVVCQLVFEVFNLIFDIFFDYKLEKEESEHVSYIISNVVGELIGVLISLYCIWVVYSFYRQLKRQDDDLPSYQYAV